MTQTKKLKEKINFAQFYHIEFVLKANHVLDMAKLETKIPNINRLVKKTY